jgi:hypothetical protein
MMCEQSLLHLCSERCCFLSVECALRSSLVLKSTVPLPCSIVSTLHLKRR